MGILYVTAIHGKEGGVRGSSPLVPLLIDHVVDDEGGMIAVTLDHAEKFLS